ncbi:MAG: PilZ domain-containing protein, partial [Deltaproteobacteria bacterium]|nr:PilZ domain-containing protein [Deltaproteobacteria bacterium]
DWTDGKVGGVSTGLTSNASEGGIMAFMGERVEVGTALNVTLVFRLGFSLASMEAPSVVVWREDVWKEYLGSYRYGLRFLGLDPANLRRLRRLFGNLERQETLYVPVHSGLTQTGPLPLNPLDHP